MKNDNCFNKKHFNYNENFNLYSLKLNNEVGSKLKLEPNFNNSSLELKLISKNNIILSKIDLPNFDDYYIQNISYNNSSNELIVNYINHDPIICDLNPLLNQVSDMIPKINIIQSNTSTDYILNINM